MADILYTYKNQVYANITNRCDCSCTFCVRTYHDGIGESENLWHKKNPTVEEVKAANEEMIWKGNSNLGVDGVLDLIDAESAPEQARYKISLPCCKYLVKVSR